MNLNRNAVAIAKEMIDRKEEFRISVKSLENGAKIIDCGVRSAGSFKAAELFIKACLGGLGDVRFSFRNLGFASLLSVQVWTDSPVVACIGSQKAAWKIKDKDFAALGSGPARILARKPKETFEELEHEESSDSAVLALECARYPGEAVAEDIAGTCGIGADKLYILVARTSSIVGSAQISARALETALHKMAAGGLDYRGVASGSADAIVAPVVGGDAKMMGVTNDMVIYGSTVYLVYSGEADVNVKKIPSSSSPAYGKHFAQIFDDAKGDFYKIDPGIFAPAEVYLNDLKKGSVERAGVIYPEMIESAIFG